MISMSLENLSAELCDIALNLRLRTPPDDLDFILTMDSIPHEQTGQKNVWKMLLYEWRTQVDDFRTAFLNQQ